MPAAAPVLPAHTTRCQPIRWHAPAPSVPADPDLLTDECAFLSRPVETEIQTDLFYDYRTNEARLLWGLAGLDETSKPPTLVVWGRFDPSFETAEAQAYKREVPEAERPVIDAGHFALDKKADDVAGYIRDFLSRHKVE